MSDQPVDDAMRGRALALHPSEVKRLRFDPLWAKQVAHLALSFLEPRASALATDYPGIDLQALRDVPTLCGRIMDLQRKLNAFNVADRSQAPQAIRAALAWRRKLFKVADALVLSGALTELEVRTLRKGAGPSWHLHALRAVITTLEPHRAVVEQFCGKQALELASAAAAEATRLIGLRPLGSQGRRELCELRDRYATLVERGHVRMRVAVSLFTSPEHAEMTVPGLYPHRRRRTVRAEPADAHLPPGAST